ncbi:YbaB/EbfC family nucleoid-associated protein [Gordonia sp. (in: high G+C Gram-positive bacteria)]|uniref:YbaB/EbfC family nucleoid-associated protein n=1 Tax=Gordonia sp. (in: high G+C Gram-positive bacteria) TaxID=84139 RepID=UPI003F9A24D9
MTDAFDPSALLGGSGGDNPMSGLLAQVQEMQAKVVAAQDEIANTEVTGQAGNGLVTVTGTGVGEVTGIEIARDVVDPDDIDTLQDLIVGALADLARNRDTIAQDKMGPLAGGMPGLG